MAATDVVFADLFGFDFPYEKTSLVKESCMQCIEPVQDEANNNNNGDQQDEDNILESCETIYAMSGKCESVLPAGTVSLVNRDACNYIEGIMIVRRDEIIETAASRPSAVATAFIVISAFTSGTCALVFL